MASDEEKVRLAQAAQRISNETLFERLAQRDRGLIEENNRKVDEFEAQKLQEGLREMTEEEVKTWLRDLVRGKSPPVVFTNSDLTKPAGGKSDGQ